LECGDFPPFLFLFFGPHLATDRKSPEQMADSGWRGRKTKAAEKRRTPNERQEQKEKQKETKAGKNVALQIKIPLCRGGFACLTGQ
jgi:hypothetical protein